MDSPAKPVRGRGGTGADLRGGLGLGPLSSGRSVVLVQDRRSWPVHTTSARVRSVCNGTAVLVSAGTSPYVDIRYSAWRGDYAVIVSAGTSPYVDIRYSAWRGDYVAWTPKQEGGGQQNHALDLH